MRSTLEDEEEELAPLDRDQNYGQRDREITLSSTTLLAIFFGLTLICALFFAFGYTLGRRTPSDAGASSPSLSSASSSGKARANSDSPSVELASSTAKPSAASQSNAAPTQNAAPLPDGSNDAGSTASVPSGQDPPSAGPGVSSSPAAVPAYIPPSATTSARQPMSSTEAVTGVMVQIAAVSNPADADVLVSALHKRGYSVAVRHEPGDALMHVQVGPFSTRAEAAAMRQKLLADGYNAILK